MITMLFGYYLSLFFMGAGHGGGMGAGHLVFVSVTLMLFRC